MVAERVLYCRVAWRLPVESERASRQTAVTMRSLLARTQRRRPTARIQAHPDATKPQNGRANILIHRGRSASRYTGTCPFHPAPTNRRAAAYTCE